ncbi:hypothetical protein GC194_13460 [bacterium]|nr:hypothetical protein [bacterium]
MEEIEEQHKTPAEKPKRKRGKVFIWTTLIVLSLFVVFQLVFLFYSDQLFGRVLKGVIAQGSKGVYQLQYDHVRFNIFRNEIEFTNVQLVSDSVRFKELSVDPALSNRLIDFSSPHISVQGPSFIKLYFDKVLKINELLLEKPVLHMRVYGELRKGKVGFRNFHEVVSEYITYLRVRSLDVRDGAIAITAINQTGRKHFEINDINSTMEGFVLNKSNENDSLISLDNLSLSLGQNYFRLDSINMINFEGMSFSTKDSVINFDNFSLQNRMLLNTVNQPSFVFKDLGLKGVNFSQMYFNNNFNARLIVADSGVASYRMVAKPDSVAAWTKISHLFDTISVDNIVMLNTQLAYEKKIGKRQPNLHLPIRRLNLQFFLLDSTAFFNDRQHFYSKNIDLDLGSFDIYSKDKSQKISTESFSLSTLRREMLLFNVSIQSLLQKPDKASVNGHIRSIQFFGLDPLIALQNNEVIARAVLFENPEINIQQPQVAGQKFNNQTLNTIVKKQFRKVHVTNIEVDNAQLNVMNAKGAKVANLQHAKLYCNNFKTYNTPVPPHKHLLSEWFTAQAATGQFALADNLHEVKLENLKVFSQKGGLFADKLQVYTKPELSDSALENLTAIKNAELYQVSIEGLNTEKLLNQNQLELEYLEAKGHNLLNFQLNQNSTGANQLEAIKIGELNIDSIDVQMQIAGNGETLLKGNGLLLQTCDFYWDTTFAPGLFTLYSIQLEGNQIAASNDQLGHLFTAKGMKINSSYNLLQFTGIKLKPFEDKYTGKTAMWYSSPVTRFSGIDLPLFFSSRQLRADNFYASKPQIAYHGIETGNNGFANFLLSPFEKTAKLCNTAHIGSIRIHEGKVHYTNHAPSKEVEYNLSDLMVYMEKFAIDSFTAQTDTNIFFSKKSEISFENFEQRANDTSMILSIGATKLYPHKHRAQLEGLELRNRKAAGTLGHFSITSEKADLYQLNFHSFLVKKTVELQKALFTDPVLTIGLRKKTADNQAFFEYDLPKAITKNYSHIYADSLMMNSARLKVNYRNNNTGTIASKSVDGWNVLFQVFEIHRNFSKLDFLYSRAILADLPDFEYELEDGLNTIKMRNMKVDVKRGSIYLDSVALSPKYDKDLYAATYGKQTDRIEVVNDYTMIHNFDFKDWLYHGNYHADKLHISETNVSVFTDKTLPEDKATLKPMPQEILHNLPVKILIDKTEFEKINVSYEEKVSDQIKPGIIYFTGMKGSVSLFTNYEPQMDTNTVKVHVETGLMKNGFVVADLTIPLGDEENTFTFNGSMNGMDMREINPLLISLVRIEISSGQTSRMDFNGTANKFVSYGEVKLIYSDLKVKVLDPDSNDDPTWKEKILQLLANSFIIKSSNRLFPKTGKIDYIRNEHKSIFNYGAKSLLTGIKTSIGLKNKEGVQSK